MRTDTVDTGLTNGTDIGIEDGDDLVGGKEFDKLTEEDKALVCVSLFFKIEK